MKIGSKLYKEGSSSNIDLSGGDAVANKGTGSEIRFNIAESGLKHVAETLSGVGDVLSYGGMATFQPELIAAG